MEDRNGNGPDRFRVGEYGLRVPPRTIGFKKGWLGRDGKNAVVIEDFELALQADAVVRFPSKEDARNFLIARCLAAEGWIDVIHTLKCRKLPKSFLTKHNPKT